MPDFTVGLIAFVFIVQAVGYTIKALIGFGNPLLTGPLLSLRLDNAVISPSGLLCDAPTNAYISYKNRRKIQWRIIIPVTIVNLLGVIPGSLLLKYSLPWVIKAVLGVLVVGISIEMATRSRRTSSAEDKPLFRYLVAFISGIFAGLYGINILIVAYIERTSKDLNAFKGSMCFLFLMENFCRIALYCATGIFTRYVLILAAITIPAALLGIVISNLIEPHVTQQQATRAINVLFLISGISILFKSLVFHT